MRPTVRGMIAGGLLVSWGVATGMASDLDRMRIPHPSGCGELFLAGMWGSGGGITNTVEEHTIRCLAQMGLTYHSSSPSPDENPYYGYGTTDFLNWSRRYGSYASLHRHAGSAVDLTDERAGWIASECQKYWTHPAYLTSLPEEEAGLWGVDVPTLFDFCQRIDNLFAYGERAPLHVLYNYQTEEAFAYAYKPYMVGMDRTYLYLRGGAGTFLSPGWALGTINDYLKDNSSHMDHTRQWPAAVLVGCAPQSYQSKADIPPEYVANWQTLAATTNQGVEDVGDRYRNWNWYMPPPNCMRCQTWLGVATGYRTLFVYVYGLGATDDNPEPGLRIITMAGPHRTGSVQLDEFAQTVRELQKFGWLINRAEYRPSEAWLSHGGNISSGSFTVPGYAGKVAALVNMDVGTWCGGVSSGAYMPVSYTFRIDDEGNAIDYVPNTVARTIAVTNLVAGAPTMYDLETGDSLGTVSGTIDVLPGKGKFIFIGSQAELDSLRARCGITTVTVHSGLVPYGEAIPEPIEAVYALYPETNITTEIVESPPLATNRRYRVHVTAASRNGATLAVEPEYCIGGVWSPFTITNAATGVAMTNVTLSGTGQTTLVSADFIVNQAGATTGRVDFSRGNAAGSLDILESWIEDCGSHRATNVWMDATKTHAIGAGQRYQAYARARNYPFEASPATFGIKVYEYDGAGQRVWTNTLLSGASLSEEAKAFSVRFARQSASAVTARVEFARSNGNGTLILESACVGQLMDTVAVNLTAPATGLYCAASVDLAAVGESSFGDVTQVVFYANGVAVLTNTTGPMSVSYQTGTTNVLTGGRNYYGAEDNVLMATNSPGNYGSCADLGIGAGASAEDIRRSLLRFDLASLAGKYSTVTSLTLRLSGSSVMAGTAGVYTVAGPNSDWSEGTGIGEVLDGRSCWGYKTLNSNVWVGSGGLCTPGIDHDTNALGSFAWTASTPVGTVYNTLLAGNTNQLKALVDAMTNTGSNAGLLLRSDDPADYSHVIVWASAEYATTNYRPRLTIGYVPVGGGSASVSYCDGETNVFTGGMLYTGTADGMIQNNAPDANNGICDSLIVNVTPYYGIRWFDLLRFDLASLAGQYQSVTSVTLRLTMTGKNSYGTGKVYRVSAANAGWVEGTTQGVAQAGSACWNFKRYSDAAHGEWVGSGGAGTAGTDYTTPWGSFAWAAGLAAGQAVDAPLAGSPAQLTSLVGAWTHSDKNAGLLIRENTEAANRLLVPASSEHGTVAWRPRLTVGYVPVCGGTWSGMTGGVYTLTAVAYDSAGARGTSTPVAVEIKTPPVVSIVSPSNGVTIAGNTVSIEATAFDSDGTIARVEFYDGATRLSHNDWLDEYGGYRRKLTVTNLAAIASPLTDFPMLAKFTAANFTFTNANPDGSDVRFTAGDGRTLLSYECERHDSANQVAEYWIKVTNLSSTVQTQFYVYYRPQPATDGQDPANVWDSDYLWVHHLGMSYEGAAWDSSTNGVLGALDHVAIDRPGYIDGAGEFDGAGCVALASFPRPTNATVETWLNTALQCQSDPDPACYVLRVNEAGKLESRVATSGGVVTNTGATTVATGGWHYVADVYGNQGRKLYLDGVEDGANADTGYPTNATWTVRRMGEGFGGLLDEVRFSKTVRSAAWIKAQEASMGNSLLQYGSAESLAATVFSWTNVTLGVHTLTAVAYDNEGFATTSAAVTITVVNDTPVPTLTAPANNTAYLRPATTSIALGAYVSNSVGTLSNAVFCTNGVALATVPGAGPAYSYTWTGPKPGKYALTARSRDSYGAVGTSTPVNILVWTNQHIGANAGDSDAAYSAPTYTVNGKGGGITGTADAFRFVYLPLTGNCTIVARVTNFTSTAANARAGVMMRASTNANAIEVSSLFMPQSNRVYLHQRTTTGGSTGTSYALASAAPYWVKLVRSGGNVFSAYRSSNGTTWTQVGSAVTISGWTATTQVLVGLAVTSGSTTGAVTGKFDNVSITVP